MCTPSPCSLATKRAPAHFSCSTRQSGAKSGARSRTTDLMCSCSRSGSRRSSVTRAPEVLRSAASALHEAQRASRLTAVAVPGDTTMSSHRATAANETSAGSMRASTVQRPSCRRPRDLSTHTPPTGREASFDLGRACELFKFRLPTRLVHCALRSSNKYGNPADTGAIVSMYPGMCPGSACELFKTDEMYCKNCLV